jgi:hypothetical protein
VSRTRVTTSDRLPGDGPRRRCPACATGWIMAGEPPALSLHGACNRCGHVVADAEPEEPLPPVERVHGTVRCCDCGAQVPRRSGHHRRCRECALRKNRENAREWNRAHKALRNARARAARKGAGRPRPPANRVG